MIKTNVFFDFIDFQVLHVDLDVDGKRLGMCLVACVQQFFRHVCA
jgi:hypothetical protein